MKRIILVDDHQLLADGMRPIINDLIPNGSVEYYCNSAEALNVPIISADDGFYILDINLGGDDCGLSLAEKLVAKNARCVVMSGDDREATITRARLVGAVGFIPKTYYGVKLILALRHIAEGREFFPRMELGSSNDLVAKLSKMQTSVLNLATQGQTNKMIGNLLGISEVTVKGHMGALMKTLGVKNRASAIAIAIGLRPGSNSQGRRIQ